jgi:hypothetical protein
LKAVDVLKVIDSIIKIPSNSPFPKGRTFFALAEKAFFCNGRFGGISLKGVLHST